MNKEKSSKKLACKKSIIRNPEQAKPKTVVILQPEMPGPSGSQKLDIQDVEVGKNVPFDNGKTQFESPELNSALRIARAIESVENIKPRKVKSVSDLDKKRRLAVDEKAAKLVNFPYYQPIYKDLIPLCTKTPPPSIQSASREVFVHKDKEPVLSDFFTPKVLPEYSFQVPAQTDRKTLRKQFDGLKLYRTMRSWQF